MQNNFEVAQELLEKINLDTNKIKEMDLEKRKELGKELISNNTFESLGVNGNLLNALYAKGFDKPSTIQSEAVPLILEGKDCAFHSKSGTGKTLGFTIGILGRIFPGAGTQAIIITPTRELNLQVSSVISEVSNQLNINVAVALREYSPESISEEIIVGCPGKILSLLTNNKISPESIKMIILDEADHMISNRAFGAQTLKLLNILKNTQKVFFSATYSELSQKAVKVISPNGVLKFTENKKADNICLYHIEVERSKKIEAIQIFFEIFTLSQTIIFANTKKMVETISEKLINDNFTVSYMHGDIPVEDRDSIFKDFAEGKTKVLVTTDVFSRGLDIPQVNLIINFDLPSSLYENASETYIHRIGRSGRFNRTGFVIDFISSPDDYEQMNVLHSSIGTISKQFTIDSLKNAFAENLNKQN